MLCYVDWMTDLKLKAQLSLNRWGYMYRDLMLGWWQSLCRTTWFVGPRFMQRWKRSIIQRYIKKKSKDLSGLKNPLRDLVSLDFSIGYSFRTTWLGFLFIFSDDCYHLTYLAFQAWCWFLKHPVYHNQHYSISNRVSFKLVPLLYELTITKNYFHDFSLAPRVGFFLIPAVRVCVVSI